MPRRPRPKRRLIALLAAAAVLAGLTAGAGVLPTADRPRTADAADGDPPFTVMNEVYGPDAGSSAQRQLAHGLANAFGFHAPLSGSDERFLATTKAPFAYFSIPASAGVGSCYPSSSDPATATVLSRLGAAVGRPVWRLGTPELDTSGGCWADGRPTPAGATNLEAYNRWMGFYLDAKGLRRHLSQPAEQRGYRWLSVCVFAFCPQYAYDLGSDAVLLERNIDEVSGMSPGIAMVRGAARQHGDKPWGIDVSTWRYWNDGPTTFDPAGKLVTGWSTSMFKRTMYAAYMSGADLLHNEAADYTGGGPGGELNPLGRTVREFTDYALTRHPDRGVPHVPVAFLQEHHSGFEPRFGEWMQIPSKWYWRIPYSSGDTMLDNLLDVAYPRHGTWGTIPPGAPWKVLDAGGDIDVAASRSAYRRALADGADPRPWEPMGTSRWGESFDVITDLAPLAAMRRYRAIVISTGAPLSDALLADLAQYVRDGGTLVVNARQLSPGAEALTGLHLTGRRASATSATWLPDGSTSAEEPFSYAVGTPTSASVLAHDASGEPIVTRNAHGSGVVYVTTPDFLGDKRGRGTLDVGVKLLDRLQDQFAVARVQGPPLQYLVSTSGPKTIVTLINTDAGGATWRGTVSFPAPDATHRVQEWTADAPVASSTVDGRVVVHATVPPYDVRVYALETAG